MDATRFLSPRRLIAPSRENLETAAEPATAILHRVILLVGLPRSGTTWLGKIFDSHPDTFYRHEPDSWGLLNTVPLFPEREDFGDYESSIKNFAASLPSMTACKVNASLPIFSKRYYSQWRLQGRRLLASTAKIGAHIFGEFPAPVLVPTDRLETLPIIWKSIESVGRAGAIVSALEKARAILLLRHPCGYAASVLRGEAAGSFTGAISASEDYGIFEMLLHTPQASAHGITLSSLRRLSPVERLAWRWALYNEKAMVDIRGRRDAVTVRYEDVCENPITKARELFEFVGLSWNRQTAEFISTSTSAEQRAYYSVIKDPMKAANKWRTELSPDDQRRVMDIVRDTIPGRLYREESLPTEAVAADV